MSEENYRVEYLTIIDASQGFCASLEGFKNFLSSHDGLSLTKLKIKYQGKSYQFSIDHGAVGESQEVYFHLKFNFKEDEIIAQNLLKLLLTSLTKTSSDVVEVLRDDFSRKRSLQAYPLIYDVENLMRKLITKFMRVKVGMHWIKNAIPDSAEARLRDKMQPYVHNYDFIELSHVLFRDYTDKGSRSLLKKIKDASKIENISLEELQTLVPRNNWDRYFSEVIAYDSLKLETHWERLYKLRCKIAHNQLLTHEEYCELKQKCSDVSKILQSAIDKLDQVQVEEEERESVIQSQSTVRLTDLNATMAKMAAMSGQNSLALQKLCNPLPDYYGNLFKGMSSLSQLSSISEMTKRFEKFNSLGMGSYGFTNLLKSQQPSSEEDQDDVAN